MHMRRSLYRFLTILTLLALLLGRASAIAGPVSSGEAEGPAPSTSRGVAVHGGAPRKDDVPGPGSDDAQVVEAFRAAPLMFIENVGQFDPRVRFQVRGASANLWLTSDALWVTVEEGDGERTREDVGFRSPSSADRETAAEPRTRRGVALKLSFRSANPSPRLEPFGRLETSVNYFIGNDPAGWRPNVPVWAGVRYVDIYPGVDLEVLSERGRWTWRLVAGESAAAALAPAPSPVALQVEGAEALAVDGGYVQATTALGKVALPLLEVQQQIWSPRAITPGIAGDTIYAPFASGGAIDDLLLSGQRASDLLYATFLGGGEGDWANEVAVDATGNAYVAGSTRSSDFPTTPGAYDTTHNESTDAFVARLNPSGSDLLYATFLGGDGSDYGDGVAVDATGNAYVTGSNGSSDFPTTSGAYDTTHNGGADVFVSKLNPSGSDLLYATFLGGGGDDRGKGIAVDGSGSAYVTGWTFSPDFPTTPEAYDTTYNGSYDAFVARVNPSGSDLPYATFLGGSDYDIGNGIAVDGPGNAYVTGYTTSSDFPTTPEAYDTTHNGGRDAFVARLPIGAGRAYSISGHVHNGSGNPISVVTVWASGTYSATTDASGQYTITNVVFGTYSLAPATAGYFWSPVSRTASVPPDATGQDFTGRNVQKAVHPGGPYAVSYGDALTYTVGVIFPEDRDLVLYDRVPTYTTYISGSLVAAAGLIYEPVANAISGRLVVSATTPTTVSFAVQVEVTGTAESAVPIVNQACVHAAEEGLGECIWSNEVRSYTYVWSTYLPLVMKNH